MLNMNEFLFQYEDVVVSDNHFRNGDEEYDLKKYESCIVEKGLNLTRSEFFWWRVVMGCYGVFAILFLIVVFAEKFSILKDLKAYLFLSVYGYGGYFYYKKKKTVYILFLTKNNSKYEVLRSEQEIFAVEVERAINRAFNRRNSNAPAIEKETSSGRDSLEQVELKRERNFCTNCGERLQGFSKFCGNCGASVYMP